MIALPLTSELPTTTLVNNFRWCLSMAKAPTLRSMSDWAEAPGMGLGLFACRKADWPGFVTGAAGFGAEELCVHEAMRNEVGGKSICLPWLRWLHSFGRPDGVPSMAWTRSRWLAALSTLLECRVSH